MANSENLIKTSVLNSKEIWHNNLYSIESKHGTAYIGSMGINGLPFEVTIYGETKMIGSPSISSPATFVSNNGVFKTGNNETVDCSTMALNGIPDSQHGSIIAHFDSFEAQIGIIHRNIKQYVFNGTEQWETNGAPGFFCLNNLQKSKVGSEEAIGFCSHYVWANGAEETPLTVKFDPNNGEKFCVVGSHVSSVVDFKAWLAQEYSNGTPMTIYYVLDQETTEEVAPQHISQNTGINVFKQISGDIPDVLYKITYRGI